MRLISQDFSSDVPYELIKLIVTEAKSYDGYNVVAINPGTGSVVDILGTYDTIEEARSKMLGPAMLLQHWVAASLFKPTPEPKVYFFGEDLEKSGE